MEDGTAFDIEVMIAEVAKRHKILLAPGDPAFALVTLNELMLKQSMTKLQGHLAELEQAFLRMSDKQLQIAKATGEAIITAGAAYVSDRFKDVVPASALDNPAKTKEASRLRREIYEAILFGAGVLVGFAVRLAF